MTTLLLLVGAGLLVVAGAMKAARPDGTARALAVPGGLVRLGAVVEVGIGASALVWTPAAFAVFGSYVLFAGFVALALVRGWSLSSCGCFGEPDTPPTIAHVVVDCVLAVAALFGTAPLRGVAHDPGWGVAAVALSIVTGGLVYLVLARLPRLTASVRP